MQNVFFLLKKKLIYLTNAYSQFGENLSEGCPEQRKTQSGPAAHTFVMVITGPSLVLFLLESCFLLTLGVSRLGVHY